MYLTHTKILYFSSFQRIGKFGFANHQKTNHQKRWLHRTWILHWKTWTLASAIKNLRNRTRKIFESWLMLTSDQNAENSQKITLEHFLFQRSSRSTRNSSTSAADLTWIFHRCSWCPNIPSDFEKKQNIFCKSLFHDKSFSQISCSCFIFRKCWKSDAYFLLDELSHRSYAPINIEEKKYKEILDSYKKNNLASSTTKIFWFKYLR